MSAMVIERAMATPREATAKMVDVAARAARAAASAMNERVRESAERYGFEYRASPREMSESERDWCFELTRRNMEATYARTWGWNAVEKRRELNNYAARYVLVRDVESGELVAFVHFRFEREDDDVDAPVGYVYELQCEPAHQRRALGETLVRVVEAISKRLGMDAVVLTVLKANVGAYEFYTKKMKYEIDALSPDASIDKGSSHYLILSKRFV